MEGGVNNSLKNRGHHWWTFFLFQKLKKICDTTVFGPLINLLDLNPIIFLELLILLHIGDILTALKKSFNNEKDKQTCAKVYILDETFLPILLLYTKMIPKSSKNIPKSSIKVTKKLSLQHFISQLIEPPCDVI